MPDSERTLLLVGAVRGEARTRPHDLADAHSDRIEVERLDITDPAGIEALCDRLTGRRFDILFVNASTANALSPIRVDEGLQHLVPSACRAPWR
jgi:short-subunit dehydrogenase